MPLFDFLVCLLDFFSYVHIASNKAPDLRVLYLEELISPFHK
jgi:hypothetical protein